MGCNAWNHHPSCNCGWGGDTGGGGWTYAGQKAPVVSHFTTDRPAARFSVTIPNARCPLCGAAVYYYESPYGGRVYFDELGPPWPKHPCTDNPSPPSAISPPVNVSGGVPRWHLDGWVNLERVAITRHATRTIIIGYGLADGLKHLFAVREPIRCEPEDPIFARRSENGDGSWEISYFPANSQLLVPKPETVTGFPRAEELAQLRQWEKLDSQDPEAHNFVGMFLGFARGEKAGDGTWTFLNEPDWAAAELHFLLAASAGYWAGFHNLGVMYQNGFGVRHDPELSMHYMLNACLLAKEEAQTSLAALTEMLAQGGGGLEDRELAQQLIASSQTTSE